MDSSHSSQTSILTATRNRPAYLAEAIASVEEQTDFDWELLIYDDASTDVKIREVIDGAKKRNPDRVFDVVSSVKGPRSPALFWNFLLCLARGKYITILDDDNRKHSEFLSRMTAPMESDSSIGATSCGWMRIDEMGKSIEDCHWNLATNEVNLWRSNTIDSNALCFRKSVLADVGVFPMYMDSCEDWHFVIRLVRACKMVHLEDVLLDYRVHRNAASTRGDDEGMIRNRDLVRRDLFPNGPPLGALVGAKQL